MADSKITALASIGTGADPANDPLVIVDVSDVSPGGMSATGTTKKVTLNNLLSCSPTATGAFTITGDLTVDTSVLKVDSTNNRVGIGTASPAYKLHVGDPTLASVGTSIDSLTQTSHIFKGTPDASGYEYAKVVSGRDTTAYTYGSYLAFYTEGKNSGTTDTSIERLRIDSTGNVGIGVTPSAGAGCLQLASGINFPATQVASANANTLDDYEEGTWTGTIQGSTTNPTTPVTTIGRYTKVGRQVNIQIAFSSVDTTGASGGVRISGVPFASADYAFGVMQSDTGVVFTGTLGCYIGPSGTVVYASAANSANTRTDGTHAAGTNRFFWINVTYTV